MARLLLAPDELADVATRNGKEDSLRLGDSCGDNSKNASLIIQERPPRVPGIDGRLSLDGCCDSSNTVIVTPRIAWTDLGDDALGQGPEVALGVSDDEHVVPDVRQSGRDWQHSRVGWRGLHQSDERQVPRFEFADDPRRDEVVLDGLSVSCWPETYGKPFTVAHFECVPSDMLVRDNIAVG